MASDGSPAQPPEGGPRLARSFVAGGNAWWRVEQWGLGARIAGGAGALVLLLLTLFAASLWRQAGALPAPPFPQPSHLYGQAHRLAPGDPASAASLAAELIDDGYKETPAGAAELAEGELRRGEDQIEVALRRCRTPQGPAGGALLVVSFGRGRIARLTVAGRPAASATLDPPLLATLYGPRLEERLPVSLVQLPPHVAQAVLAAEDHSFFNHPGISIPAMARALWVDLRGHHVYQGGSTITQQLAKNLYLSSHRTLRRKAREAALAFLLEIRHGKHRLLEAYLNTIYWGKSGPAELIGLGAAARAYFGKDATHLSLAEAATLAAMIRAPSDYSPLNHRAAALQRRNHILARMASLGWVSAEQALAARREPLVLAPPLAQPLAHAPYFTDAMEQEARARFGITDLAGGGYQLFSTLDPARQRAAEQAVAEGLSELQQGRERRHRGDALEAALLSVDPRSGAIRAYVGGRDHKISQYDRISQARRPLGSAFKPVIYAAAFEDGVANPATLLTDLPVVVRTGGADWLPQDDDHTYRGRVTARAALEQSLNVPAVRLAFAVGLPRIAALAREMGVASGIEPRPALALGALEVSPREVAQTYSTLAAGGVRWPIHGLEAVLDGKGEPVAETTEEAPRRVLSPQVTYVVTSVLQGVLSRGTAAGARALGFADPLAGKTGTTNERRDSWFAGYSADLVSVVWVGYDDDSGTRLSGATGAVPIWVRYMQSVRPRGGFARFVRPPGLTEVTLDPESGQLATAACTWRVTELVPEWQAPLEPCRLHAATGGFEIRPVEEALPALPALTVKVPLPPPDSPAEPPPTDPGPPPPGLSPPYS